ncbi:hypothetical protein [Chengkuizengella sediminis]|uniref:hypothetical protein n=1 Tax=Chengkuizengella sediminis TaxID=1885917 RepID=UPI001389B861|nr:hypothetical protein [Chengkuizengella sediminis]NDI36616.1 hypothetical protein [Chengkuizengella sediminis]
MKLKGIYGITKRMNKKINKDIDVYKLYDLEYLKKVRIGVKRELELFNRMPIVFSFLLFAVSIWLSSNIVKDGNSFDFIMKCTLAISILIYLLFSYVGKLSRVIGVLDFVIENKERSKVKHNNLRNEKLKTRYLKK